ncbi:hypothetical protein ACGFJT_07930 [Actinomadura geliboluensis]|uniref:hypothetical protein n=1 Tax=Actinomadura geliboluensis TaxID=882440 RepID=UPI0037216AD8
MPSTDHEMPLELVREKPVLAPVILQTVFGLDIPYDAATLSSESFAGLNPAELRCDATVVLDDPKKPSHGIIVESQLKFDEDKIFSWPAYAALLRHRHRCGATLLVFCPNAAVAERCAQPIDMGHPEWVLRPLTVHPGMLPPVTDPDQARQLPELAVYSAPAHADGPHAEAVLTSVAAAIAVVAAKEHDHGCLYDDYLAEQFSEAARKLLEEIVKTAGYEWKSDFAKTHRAKGRAEGRVEGRAEGEAKALLVVLEGRGIAVPNEVRKRVLGCTDSDQLERWLKRAAVVERAEDLLD